MTRPYGPGPAAPGQARDIPALIRSLASPDPSVQWHAAEALGRGGAEVVPPLLEALHSRAVPVRLGAVEALGAIRDPRALEALIPVAGHDTSLEVRWAAVLALGELGSLDAIPVLTTLVRDPDRYIRYGAATALETLGWHPQDEAETASLLIARQDWASVGDLGAAALPQLIERFRDPDPLTRERIIAVLSPRNDPSARALCQAGLRDRDPRTRWNAVLASINCGLASHELPLFVAARERTGPDPVAAGLLNFLFLGIGYNYIGKWWGFPVFMTYMSVLVLAQLALGPFLPYLIAYPLTAVIGIHTYYAADRMSDL